MAFILSIHNAIAAQVGGDALRYNAATLGGLPAFSTDDPSPSGYTDVSSLANWETYGWATGLSFETYRNLLIDQYLAGWAGLSDDDKRILVRHYVCPTGTGQAELDALWSTSKRQSFRSVVIEELQLRRLLIRESLDGTLWVVKIDNAGAMATVKLETHIALS